MAVRGEGRPLHACVIVQICFTLSCFIMQIVHCNNIENVKLEMSWNNYHGILRLQQGKIKEFCFLEMLGTLQGNLQPREPIEGTYLPGNLSREPTSQGTCQGSLPPGEPFKGAYLPGNLSRELITRRTYQLNLSLREPIKGTFLPGYLSKEPTSQGTYW